MQETKTVFRVPPGQRQLFLDDHGVARIAHLSGTMHQPEKKGAVIRPDPPLEVALQTRCAPAWDPDEGVFGLWLSTSTSVPGRVTYAASEDGLHWTKRFLRPEAIAEWKRNPTQIAEPGADWATDSICHVLHDPDDPDPARRYKGLGHRGALEPMISPDGIHWQRLDVPKIPSSDESNLSYDSAARTYIATVKQGGSHGRCVFLSTSEDFEHWTDPELIFHADDLDQVLGRERIEARFADSTLKAPEYDIPDRYNVDVYNMGAFRYEGFYIGLPSMFYQSGRVPKDWAGFDDMGLSPEILDAVRQYGDWTGFHHVQLACSRDLHHWERVGDRQPFIDASAVSSGAYDLQCIIGPSFPVVRGNELWFYYTGIRNYAYVSSNQGDNGAICLAVLRRDGFVSLDAGAKEGVLLTQPFTLNGGSLYVNVDAPKGALRVEVLGEGGEIVAASSPVQGDQPQGEVRFEHGNLDLLQGQQVCLRFLARHARFYSYWLER
ncbi:MAG: hypothetical protein V1800_12310 [Candidatus Latescibacterota bacterium]